MSQKRSVQKAVVLPNARGLVYPVVSEVEHYPQFLPWCTDVSIVEETRQHFENGDHAFEADIQFEHDKIGRETIRHQLMMRPNEMIISRAHGSRLFKSLCYKWHMEEQSSSATAVQLRVDFEVDNAIHAMAFDVASNMVVDKVFKAFLARLEQLQRQEQRLAEAATSAAEPSGGNNTNMVSA